MCVCVFIRVYLFLARSPPCHGGVVSMTRWPRELCRLEFYYLNIVTETATMNLSRQDLWGTLTRPQVEAVGQLNSGSFLNSTWKVRTILKTGKRALEASERRMQMDSSRKKVSDKWQIPYSVLGKATHPHHITPCHYTNLNYRRLTQAHGIYLTYVIDSLLVFFLSM